MRLLIGLIGIVLFALFWMISTPIYALATMCDWLDMHLSQFLDDILHDWLGDGR